MKSFIFILMLSITGIFIPENSFAQERYVYVTPKGKKYHYQDCSTLARSKRIIQLTINEAKGKGYTPCKVCNPPYAEINKKIMKDKNEKIAENIF